MKLHRLQQEQLERMKNLDTKESEMDGNMPSLGSVQDEKRTDSDISKNSSSDDRDEKPKPKPNKASNKFPLEISGGYAPEPYQFLPTFDEKELAKQYNVSIFVKHFTAQ